MIKSGKQLPDFIWNTARQKRGPERRWKKTNIKLCEEITSNERLFCPPIAQKALTAVISNIERLDMSYRRRKIFWTATLIQYQLFTKGNL